MTLRNFWMVMVLPLAFAFTGCGGSAEGTYQNAVITKAGDTYVVKSSDPASPSQELKARAVHATDNSGSELPLSQESNSSVPASQAGSESLVAPPVDVCCTGCTCSGGRCECAECHIC